MDIGDLIFLVILGLGFLSSLGGARRKKGRAQRPRQPSRAQRGSGSSQPAAGKTTSSRKSRMTEARDRALSQMEELLRELEGVPKPTEPKKRDTTPPLESVEYEPESPDLSLPPSAPPEREIPPEAPPVRDGSLHKAFHDKYIRQLAAIPARSQRPRARRHLSQKNLRDAVLAREILGPPKALR